MKKEIKEALMCNESQEPIKKVLEVISDNLDCGLLRNKVSRLIEKCTEAFESQKIMDEKDPYVLEEEIESLKDEVSQVELERDKKIDEVKELEEQVEQLNDEVKELEGKFEELKEGI